MNEKEHLDGLIPILAAKHEIESVITIDKGNKVAIKGVNQSDEHQRVKN